MPPRAVLFDFDGVIANTENVHVAAWQRTFGVMGWDETDETCALAAEVDDREFVAQVFARRKIVDGDVEGWARRKQELTLSLLGDAPRLYPGVEALVNALRGRVALGVVSTSWRGSIEAVLKASHLLDAFDVVIAKEDVQHPKPDPEGYTRALDRLGLTAGEVVALEDSPHGLAAARGAKIRVLAVGHRRGAGDWTGESAYLPELADVTKVLAAIEL